MPSSMPSSAPSPKPFRLPAPIATIAALAMLAMLAIAPFASLGCRGMGPRPQEWVVCAPEKAMLGVSLHLGWTLERPEVRDFIARYPVFDQTLEIFLDKVKMDPASETARASLYVLDIPGPDAEMASPGDFRGMILVQVAGFTDPRAVHRAVVENFPPEGSLRVGGREYPLFVFFDINGLHLRVFIDGDDRLWVGDAAALQGVANRRFVGDSAPLAKAAEWIQASGAVQGFVQPGLLPKDILGGAPYAIQAGIKGLAWSVSTVEKDAQALSLSLAAAGTEEGIAAARPWAQRLAAMASAASGGGAPPPETLQEKTRMGLKCQIGPEQMDAITDMVARLDQAIALPLGAAAFKPFMPGAPK
jgi:hypothetical protein